jgi:hypothetical protein
MVYPARVNIGVVVELSGGLSALVDDRDRRSHLTKLLMIRIGDLLTSLGLPGEPAVRVIEGGSGRPLRVRVQDTLLPYSPGLLRRCWLVSTIAQAEPASCPPAVDESPGEGFPSDWLEERLVSETRISGLAELSQFVALVVLGILRDRPSSLLSDRVVAAYRGRRRAGAPPSAAVREVLTTLLDLGVPVARRAVILEALGESAERPPADVAEQLFNVLRPSRVEIRAARSYLEALGCEADRPHPIRDGDGVANENMRLVEQALLADGLHVPDLYWTPVDGRSGIAAVNVNGVQGPPARALDPDEYLVDHGEEWMHDHDIPVARTLDHPLTGATCAVIRQRDAEQVMETGGNLMPPGAYLAVLVFRDLLASPDRLIGLDESLYDLSLLHRVQPVLVESAVRTIGVGDVTRVRRAHAAAGLPVKDLRLLLEHVLVHAATEPAHSEDTFVQATREGLATQLVSRFRVGSEPLVLVELDEELLTRLAVGPPLDEGEQEAVRDSLWTLLRNRRLRPSQLLLVVPTEALAATRSLVKAEIPEASVLARAEIPPGLEAETTISLSTAGAV